MQLFLIIKQQDLAAFIPSCSFKDTFIFPKLVLKSVIILPTPILILGEVSFITPPAWMCMLNKINIIEIAKQSSMLDLWSCFKKISKRFVCFHKWLPNLTAWKHSSKIEWNVCDDRCPADGLKGKVTAIQMAPPLISCPGLHSWFHLRSSVFVKLTN